jgi:uncharacterized membrane protein YphA (DoxX/SURF4 family)
MRIAMIIVTSLLALAAFASATGKLRRSPQVIEAMTHVGVKQSQVPLLGLIEIAGGAGLLIGFASVTLGRLAAAGLVAYFFSAVFAHLRIKDRATVVAPAAFLLALSVVTFALQIQR